MAEVVSIVIAVVSAVVSLLSVGFTGWISYYRDQVKERQAAAALRRKYEDPLTQAAYDLQSRLYGLVDHTVLDHIDDEKLKEFVIHYTVFLFGQYFSWVYILRREAQFMRFSAGKENNKLMIILDKITNELAVQRTEEGYKVKTDTDPDPTPIQPFMLWRGPQSAIGEVMTLQQENGQLYCMGFAAFVAKYKADEDFKHWFQVIDHGITALAAARKEDNIIAANRLRRLQHLFIDMIRLVGSTLLVHSLYPKAKGSRAPYCECEDPECVAALLAATRKKANEVP